MIMMHLVQIIGWSDNILVTTHSIGLYIYDV